MTFILFIIDISGRTEPVTASFCNPHDAIAEGLRVADKIVQQNGFPPLEQLTHKDAADVRRLGFFMSVISQKMTEWAQWWTMDDFRAYINRTKRRETAAQFFRRWNVEKHGGRI